MFISNKRYICQWRYDALKMWMWSDYGFTFRRKKSALKYIFKKLARNSDSCPWRIVEWNKEDNTYTVIFESSIDRVPLREYNLKQFTSKEVKRYYKKPIIIDGKKGRK